jgi:hypothetical protein
MFSNIKSFYNWVETISTAILGLFSGYLIHEIEIEKGRKWLIVVLAVLAIVMAEKLLHMIFSKIINSSQRLRRSILRGHFIEGKWLGVVRNTGESSDIYGYSYVTIMYSDKGYEVMGKIFNPKTNEFNGGFRSSDSHYYNEERLFTYYFEGFNQHDNMSDEIIGKVKLNVTQMNPIPTEFMGTITDTKNKKELNIELYKIRTKLHEEHDATTKKGLKKIIEEMT